MFSEGAFFISFACPRIDFELIWKAFVDLGALGAAGGGPRHKITRKRQPQAKKGIPFWDTVGSWRHNLLQCVLNSFVESFFEHLRHFGVLDVLVV